MKPCIVKGGLLIIILTLPRMLSAEDQNDEVGKSKAPPAVALVDPDPKADLGKLKGRLPSGWGKLNVTDAQRQNIYKIQAGYSSQLAALKQQISELEAKRDIELRKVLTAQQQRLLDLTKAPKTAVAGPADPAGMNPADPKKAVPKSNKARPVDLKPADEKATSNFADQAAK